MSGNSIGFDGEIKKLFKKMFHLHMIIWSPENPTWIGGI